MPYSFFNLSNVHPSWQPLLQHSIKQLDPNYLQILAQDKNWLPGPDKIFSAFSLPLDQTNYILFGESPYPRADSANGYAFWDARVTQLWSKTGLEKSVNRATSLRNIIKMLLVAEGLLDPDKTSQQDIASLDKKNLVQTNSQLFNNFLKHGFLLLNATPVLRNGEVKQDAEAWYPFLACLLSDILQQRPTIQLVLLGRIAGILDKILAHHKVKTVVAEHPYNLSFIQNPKVLDFFRPLRLSLL